MSCSWANNLLVLFIIILLIVAFIIIVKNEKMAIIFERVIKDLSWVFLLPYKYSTAIYWDADIDSWNTKSLSSDLGRLLALNEVAMKVTFLQRFILGVSFVFFILFMHELVLFFVTTGHENKILMAPLFASRFLFFFLCYSILVALQVKHTLSISTVLIAFVVWDYILCPERTEYVVFAVFIAVTIVLALAMIRTKDVE